MQEIPTRLLLKTITARRLWNAAAGLASLLISAARRKPVVWGRPFILTVEPTNVCNLRCPLCVTGNGTLMRRAGLMPLERFREIIDALGDDLFYLLLYQQGEPFLHPHFVQFVEYAKRKRIFVTTSTNGHYLNPKMAEQVVASGLDSIIISVDGADQETYEKYRVRGHLQTVLEGIANLLAVRQRSRSRTPVVFLQFIVMKQNARQIPSMRKLARELGVDRLLIKTVQVTSPEEAKTWLPDDPKLRRYDFDGSTLQTKRRGRGPCPRPWTSTLVNWDGTVVPCCFDKNGQHTFGRADENHDLNALWHSENYERFRQDMLTNRSGLDICANCSQGLRLYR